MVMPDDDESDCEVDREGEVEKEIDDDDIERDDVDEGRLKRSDDSIGGERSAFRSMMDLLRVATSVESSSDEPVPPSRPSEMLTASCNAA
jgi:hypothetical protein